MKATQIRIVFLIELLKKTNHTKPETHNRYPTHQEN
jgi:hypothetical protein